MGSAARARGQNQALAARQGLLWGLREPWTHPGTPQQAHPGTLGQAHLGTLGQAHLGTLEQSTWGPRDNDNWQCLGGDGRPWSSQRPGVSAGVRGSWGRGALRPAAILTGGRSLVAGPLGTQAPLKHPRSSEDSKAGGDDGSGPAAAAGGDSEAGTGSGARLSCVPRTRPDPLASNNKHDSNPSQGWRCGGGRPWELRGRKTWGSLSRACGRG